MINKKIKMKLKRIFKSTFAGLCGVGLCLNSAFSVYASPSLVSANTMDAETDKTGDQPVYGADYIEDEVIVVLKDEVSPQTAARLLEQDAVVQQIEFEADTEDLPTYAVLELPDDMEVTEAIDYYESMPEVEYAQPNYIYEVEEETENLQIEYSANDPFFNNQWYLDAIGVTDAWDLVKNKKQQDVIVAVIDTGIDLTHPDLRDNLDAAHCVSSVTTEYQPISNDFTGHGTHVAGEIAAVVDNGVGVSGISNNTAKIAAIQCSDGNKITTGQVANGIRYAMEIHAGVINMSLGMSKEDQVLKDALRKAWDAGILTVCSAGNDGTDNKHYPSAYDSTIGVIATTRAGNKRSTSSYGTDNFISAPGDNMYSTVPINSYRYMGGSSMAAGVVTGVVALMKSLDPTLSPEEIKTLLAETATDIYQDGFDAYSGYGIVNAGAVVQKILDTRDIPDKDIKVPETDKPDDKEKENPEISKPDDADNDIPSEILNPGTTEGFVQRLYYYGLGRTADEAGLKDWVHRLDTKAENGGQVAMGFLFSEEFLNKNMTDEQFVNTLYHVFLGREGDAEGVKYWQNKLKIGKSRLDVMNGFSGSEEFSVLCKRCGFTAGQVPSREMRDQNEAVTAFVSRLYGNALGRTYDVDGLNDWCGRIIRRQMTAKDVAVHGFFDSVEFENKHTTDEEFVTILYHTFLDREPEKQGYDDWCRKLRKGYSREQLVRGFAASAEFTGLMAGLQK